MKKLFSDFNFTWAVGLFGTAVGAGIAMGDACEALKAVATHVTGTLEEDGIARALVDLGVLAARDVGL